MNNVVQIEVLKSLGTFEEGQIVKVAADKNGIPMVRFWRKRLKDAEIDQCCKLVEGKTEKPKQPKKTAKKIN